MVTERFYVFTMLIDSIHKSIHKLKLNAAPELGVKSVHIFWIYELYGHPDGLTAAELAAESMVSRSLISREIEYLLDNGYIRMMGTAHGKRPNYNSRLVLTEAGKELAASMVSIAMQYQAEADEGIDPAELESFYRTLRKICNNLYRASLKPDKAIRQASATVPKTGTDAVLEEQSAINPEKPLTNCDG